MLRGFSGSDDDRAAVFDICVRTGDAGRDARAAASAVDGAVDGAAEVAVAGLLDRYAAPYLELEPEFALVAELDGVVVGYALGALDTRGFADRFEAWRGNGAGGGDSLNDVERREHAESLRSPESVAYPSHLHIDLLPAAQGRGAGRLLIEELVTRLAAAGSTGVHLGVDPRNIGALAFYPRVGFTEVRRSPDAVVFTRRL